MRSDSVADDRPTATISDVPTTPGHGWAQLLKDGTPLPGEILWELPYDSEYGRNGAHRDLARWADQHGYRIRYGAMFLGVVR